MLILLEESSAHSYRLKASHPAQTFRSRGNFDRLREGIRQQFPIFDWRCPSNR